MFWICDPSSLHLDYWVFEIQSMDLFEIKVLVSFLLRVSPCCWRWFQRFHVRGRGLQDELDELWPVFLCCYDVSLVGSLSQSSFLFVFGEERGRTGSPQTVSPGFSSLRPTSSFVSDPSFLFLEQTKSTEWLWLCWELLSRHLSWSLRHVSVETRCKYHKRTAGVCLMCHQSQQAC